MQTAKETFLNALAEKQERGLIPKLTEEEQLRAQERIDARIKKLGSILNDAGLSDLDCLRKFGAFLQAMDRRDGKGSARALKRYWRRRELARRKGRKGRRRQKRFR